MIENHNDRLLNQLRQHPEREPRAEIKNRLKTNLREKAQIMDRKQSFYPVLKIAGVSLASVFIIILLVSSGLEPLKNSMNQFLGSGGGSETPIVDISDEVTDETVVPPGEEEPIENKMLVLEEMYQDLLDKDVWDEAAQTFVDYLQAVFANDQQAIDVLSFTDFKGEEQINELVLFYEKNIMKESLKVVDVQFSRGEPEVSVLLFYKDLDGEEKAGWYVISNQMEHFEIYDTIQAQHDEPVFQVTEKIMEVYERFAENYSDDALIGLTAEEFVMLYAYTSQLEDYETLYELHILDEEKYTFLDKEQYLQEMKESSSKTFADTMENEVLAMYQVYFDEETDDGFVRLVMKDNLDFPGIFRLTFEEGVWKSHWLPTQ